MKPQRNISAPFQQTTVTATSNSPSSSRSGGSTGRRPKPALIRSSRPEDRVDYLSHKFVPLESDSHITFEKYCGPTPESNWVIPGKLLVGAYPASQDDSETFELLTSILRFGVNQFICLQLEYRADVTEAMWRRGQGLRPYFEDVKLLVKNKHKFKILSEEGNVCESEHLSFVHFPIKDCSVTDDAGVFQLALDLVESISKGRVQYLHCWGGHGRTGTLVCIMLHLMYGLTADEAMNYCQKVHDLRQCPVVVGSPQTQTQCDQVVRIISVAQGQVLTTQRRLNQKAAALTASAPSTTVNGTKEGKQELENLDDNGSNSTDLASNSSSSISSMSETPEGNHVKKARSLSANLNNSDTQSDLQPQKYRVVETKNSTQAESPKSGDAITIPALQTRKNSSTQLPGPPLTLLTTQKAQRGKSVINDPSSNSDIALTPIVPQQLSSPNHPKKDPRSAPTKNDHFQFTPTPPKKLNSRDAMKKENEVNPVGSPPISAVVAGQHPQPPKDRQRGSNSTHRGSVKDTRKLSYGNSSTPSPSTEKKEIETSPVRAPLTMIINSTTTTQPTQPSPVSPTDSQLFNEKDRRNLSLDLDNEVRIEVMTNGKDHPLDHFDSNDKADDFRAAVPCAPLIIASCNN